MKESKFILFCFIAILATVHLTSCSDDPEYVAKEYKDIFHEMFGQEFTFENKEAIVEWSDYVGTYVLGISNDSYWSDHNTGFGSNIETYSLMRPYDMDDFLKELSGKRIGISGIAHSVGYIAIAPDGLQTAILYHGEITKWEEIEDNNTNTSYQ